VSLPDIDPFKNQRELFSLKDCESIDAKGRPREAVFFQALTPEAKAIFSPIEDLNCCFRFAAEYKDVSACRILS
jgi:hypothetical protein